MKQNEMSNMIQFLPNVEVNQPLPLATAYIRSSWYAKVLVSITRIGSVEQSVSSP